MPELRLEEGEYRAYIEYKHMGFCLTFTDEAMFRGFSKQTIGSGPLYFSGVFFYAEGKDEYVQYDGWLPKSIGFEKTSSQLNQSLGQAEWSRKRSDGSLAYERWVDGKLKIHVTYDKTKLTPSVIAISKPDKQI